jgi:hypothetical protein
MERDSNAGGGGDGSSATHHLPPAWAPLHTHGHGLRNSFFARSRGPASKKERRKKKVRRKMGKPPQTTNLLFYICSYSMAFLSTFRQGDSRLQAPDKGHLGLFAFS